MDRLKGRSVIITGAAQGIGAAFAHAVAAHGAKVTVCDLLSTAETVDSICQEGGQAIGHICDVTDGNAVRDMVQNGVSVYGCVQGLGNNAALFAQLPKRPFEEISSAEFDRVMAVNVRGAFECAKAVSAVMRLQRYGKIVNVASGTVFKGQMHMLSYVTSKGAVVAMTRCLAREFGPSGVSVNCLAPGFTMSGGVKQHPDWIRDGEATIAGRAFRREQSPGDLTGALIYLLSEDSDFMTGQTLVVDGGSVMR